MCCMSCYISCGMNTVRMTISWKMKFSVGVDLEQHHIDSLVEFQ